MLLHHRRLLLVSRVQGVGKKEIVASEIWRAGLKVLIWKLETVAVLLSRILLPTFKKVPQQQLYTCWTTCLTAARRGIRMTPSVELNQNVH